MRIVEVIDNKIRISNELILVGDLLTEKLCHNGYIKPTLLRLDMTKLQSFVMVAPYQVALRLAGKSQSEIEASIKNKLRFVDENGSVMDSDLGIACNQIPAFTDPRIYELIGFVELQFLEFGELRSFFIFDLLPHELDFIDKYVSVNAVASGEEPANTATASPLVTYKDTGIYSCLLSIKKRLAGNLKSILIFNILLLLVPTIVLLCFGLSEISFYMLAVVICIFNTACYLLISNNFVSKRLLLNPFVSGFGFFHHEFMGFIKYRGERK